MSDTLVPSGEGAFSPVQAIASSPVPGERAISNIEESVKFDHPLLMAERPGIKDTIIFVAGGPTLRDYVEEIRERQAAGIPILTSNNTYDWLVARGIVPDMCLIFDPKEKVAGYVTNPQQSTQFFLGVVVNPKTFERFAGFNVKKVVVAYGLEGREDVQLQQRLYPKARGKDFLIGGTMTPLRAMPFAVMLGYRKIEFYGFDSCFSPNPPPVVYQDENQELFNQLARQEGMPIHKDIASGRIYAIQEPDDGGYFYAYKKERQEDLQVAEIAGRRFLTSPGFAYQAEQLQFWVDRLEGRLEVVVHGDSLSSWMLAARRVDRERLQERIGKARWTPEYAAMQAQMHTRGDYGTHGERHLSRAAIPILGLWETLKRTVKVLDYGCGGGQLGRTLRQMLNCATITDYDPFHPEWGGDREVELHDFCYSFDVFEHVEEICVDNVIDWIADHIKYGAYFEISLVAALKELPDGRNAHITIKSPEWWIRKMKRRFNIIEAVPGECLILVVEKFDVREVLAAEQNSV